MLHLMMMKIFLKRITVEIFFISCKLEEQNNRIKKLVKSFKNKPIY